MTSRVIIYERILVMVIFMIIAGAMLGGISHYLYPRLVLSIPMGALGALLGAICYGVCVSSGDSDG